MIMKGFAPENGIKAFAIMKTRGPGGLQRPQPGLPRVPPPATPRDPVTRAQRTFSWDTKPEQSHQQDAPTST